MKNKRTWAALVNIRPQEGHQYDDLVDLDISDKNKYIGAWAKVIVNAKTLIDAYHLILKGIAEKGFIVFDFDYIRDYDYFKENYELDAEYKEAEDLLNNSAYLFTIVGLLYPYTDLDE